MNTGFCEEKDWETLAVIVTGEAVWADWET